MEPPPPKLESVSVKNLVSVKIGNFTKIGTGIGMILLLADTGRPQPSSSSGGHLSYLGKIRCWKQLLWGRIGGSYRRSGGYFFGDVCVVTVLRRCGVTIPWREFFCTVLF